MADVEIQCRAVQTEFANLQKELQNRTKTRKSLLAALKRTVAVLESPHDPIMALMMGPHQSTVLYVIVCSGILDLIVKAKHAQTAQQLEEISKVDASLIVRLMRPLTAMGIFREVERETYAATPISLSLAHTPALLGGFKFMCSVAHRSLANLPLFLERAGMRNVTATPGPLQDALQTDKGLFDWINDDPSLHASFNDFKAGQSACQQDWHDLFPFQTILFPSSDHAGEDQQQSPVLFVDIGNGSGHFTGLLQNKLGVGAPGQLILQKLPQATNSIQVLDPAIVRMNHDVFEEQPIKAARAYFFRSVFHDRADNDCISILKRTAEAMKANYSRVLIFEWVLPEQGTPLYPALLDINMMCLLNGMERTKPQWERLLDGAGLKIVKIWSAGETEKSLIEAELQ